MKRNERVADPIEQAAREEAEFIAVRLRRFPRARIVKTEMLFDRQRNFNRDATFPPVRLALINLCAALGPRLPITFARLSVKKVALRKNCSISAFRRAGRSAAGSFFQFSHAIVPDRHKDEARIFSPPEQTGQVFFLPCARQN